MRAPAESVGRSILSYSLAIGISLVITLPMNSPLPSSGAEKCITITSPTEACSERPFEFSARLNDGSTTQLPTYNWTVSAGSIVRGKYTPDLFVSGNDGQHIKATVTVTGLKPSCEAKARSSEITVENCDKGPGNRPPVISAFSLSTNLVTLNCPKPKESSGCKDATEVQVHVDASDSEGDLLRYKWKVTGGKVVGKGPTVVWNLAGVRPGKYTITIKVDDGQSDLVATQSRTVVVIACVDCKPL